MTGNVDSIQMQLNKQAKEEHESNKAKLRTIVETVLLCGRQDLALRGDKDSGRLTLEEWVKNDGNLRALLRYRANGGDCTLAEHIRTAANNALYTRPTIQNEIISIIGNLIQDKIVEAVHKAGFFAVLADETDGSAVQDIKRAFGRISDICLFFRAPPKRTALLKRHLEESSRSFCRLLRYCETTWVERHEAVSRLSEALPQVVAALEDFMENSRDTTSTATASALHRRVCSFNFLLCLAVSERFLGLTHHLSEYLQITSVDMSSLFPNVHTLLKILATLPVTTATVERSFSTLRRLKTYLRNRTAEDRLNGLDLINRAPSASGVSLLYVTPEILHYGFGTQEWEM
ncbi:hypothetical protein HPB47_022499 [Ixodes persulcatus]|uniref:Uncharacterized protein n=1 Tax=Ixodes persulcatus TaxID=34615 RepID=A0AC60Q9J1_IXOPE|nr:hypothetical protein HPB47_022499 [Ixodes persulcatus]